MVDGGFDFLGERHHHINEDHQAERAKHPNVYIFDKADNLTADSQGFLTERFQQAN